MNKSEELSALDRFVESLPADTYLADLLKEARPFIERDLRCDLALDTIGDLLRHRASLAAEIKEARAAWLVERQQIESDRRKWQIDLKEAQRAIDQIRESARELFPPNWSKSK